MSCDDPLDARVGQQRERDECGGCEPAEHAGRAAAAYGMLVLVRS